MEDWLYMKTRPTRAWVLGMDGPKALEGDALDGAFQKYEDTGFEPKLEFLYEIIDCTTVEMIVLPGLGVLWIDESGRLKEREINHFATPLYQYVYRNPEPVVGTAVLIVHPEIAQRLGADRDKKIIDEIEKSLARVRGMMN